MKNDDLYGRNGSNSGTPNSRLNRKSSISSDQTESFRMIDIDVKKAKKDIDDIFSYTKDKLNGNSKDFSSSMDDIFKRATTQSDQFFKNMDTKIDQLFNSVNSQMDKLERRASDLGETIAVELSGGYNTAYDQLDARHKQSISNRLKEEQKLAKDISKLYEDTFANKSSTQSSILNSISNSMNNNTSTNGGNGIVPPNINNQSTSFKSFALGELKTGIIDAILTGGKEFIDIWIRRFEAGMNRIVDTYEDTFHNVSVLTDTSQKSYMQMQDNIVDYLNENNYHNAIRTSEVMQNMHDAVMQGITNAGEAQNIALENSITKAINPFINVTTDAYQDMQMSLGSDFVNSANAIVKAVNDGTTGTTRFISKNIDDMLTQFEPVILNAKSEQFDKQFAEMAADLEAAVASGAMTSQQAEEYKQSVYSMTNNPYNTITNSNDISLVRSMLDSLQNGDFENQNIEGMLKTLAENDEKLYEGTQSAFARDIVRSNIGSDRTSIWQDSDALNEVTKIINDKNSGDYEDALTSLTKGLEDTYTNLWQKDTGAENDMLFAAKFKQQYPDAFAILTSMLSVLKTIAISIGSQALLNVGGKLFGKFGSKIISKITNTKVFQKGANLFKNAFKSGSDDMAKAAGKAATNYSDDVLRSASKAASSSADDMAKAAASSSADDMTKAAASYGDDVLKAAGSGSKATGILSKIGSIASKASGPLTALGFVIDGFQGFGKSEDWYGDNSAGSKAKSTLGAIAGGSGPGVGQGSVGSVALNAGSNALKWGSVGGMVGGPLGLAIGAGAGLVTGLVGGERMGDFFGGIGNFIKKTPQIQFLGKEFKTLKDNISSLGRELKDVWTDDNLNFGEKIGASFGTAKASIEDTFKDTFSNIKEAFDNSFLPDMVDGLKSFGSKALDILGGAKDKVVEFGKGVKDEFNKFTDNPIDYVKEKGKGALDALGDFGKGALDKLGDAKDGFINFFKNMGKASSDAEKKAKEKDKKESKGSHASGLNYVPYDGYQAILHKGETVFNRTASNIISQFMGLTGTSNSVNTSAINNIVKTLIKNDPKSYATTASEVDTNNKLAKVSEELLNKDSAIQQTFDTTNLEKAIYAIGDRIVSAITNQSKNNNTSIVDRSSGTVNVRFGNPSSSDSDLTLSELPV